MSERHPNPLRGDPVYGGLLFGPGRKVDGRRLDTVCLICLQDITPYQAFGVHLASHGLKRGMKL